MAVHRKEHVFSYEAPEEPCVNEEDIFEINIPLIADTVVARTHDRGACQCRPHPAVRKNHCPHRTTLLIALEFRMEGSWRGR